MTPTDELKRIYPGRKLKLESGEEITVSPVRFGKLAEFGEAVASLIAKVSKMTDVSFAELGPKDIGVMFSVAFKELVDIMAMVLRKDQEWFDDITLADGMDILAVILEQNFSEENKKKFEQLLAKMPSSSA